jgi:hypothetical protein
MLFNVIFFRSVSIAIFKENQKQADAESKLKSLQEALGKTRKPNSDGLLPKELLVFCNTSKAVQVFKIKVVS